MVDQSSQELLKKSGFQEQLIRYFKDMYFYLKMSLISLFKVRYKVFFKFLFYISYNFYSEDILIYNKENSKNSFIRLESLSLLIFSLMPTDPTLWIIFMCSLRCVDPEPLEPLM